ncbi:hypothetical protein C723_3454 [Christiangramia flava JLT2011]|nr:hypothetical protein C723_3454 [Christiangramia flava JLT2011]
MLKKLHNSQITPKSTILVGNKASLPQFRIGSRRLYLCVKN